jgi:hypothetical protein
MIKLLLQVLCGALASCSLGAAEFHVSVKGVDSNPGTKDLPFATLARARDAVRSLKARSGLPEGGVDVFIHGGEYVLTETVELTPQDSGAPLRPIRYRAADGETPVFTSAQPIQGWRTLTDDTLALPATAKGKVWFAQISKGWRFHSFFVNGVVQQVARAPKSGLKDWRSWPKMVGAPRITPEGMWVGVPDDLLTNLPGNGDVEVNFLPVEWWNTLPVLKRVEGNQVLLASRNPSTWTMEGRYVGYNAHGEMSFRNALAFLTQPGEWCVDSAAGRVYYWPPDGSMTGKTAAAPKLCELLRLQGDDLMARSDQWRVKFDPHGNRVEASTPALPYSSPSAFEQVVHQVELRGLSFVCTDRLPEDHWPVDWLKRNCENPDGALFLQGVEECVIEDCVFHDCGAYAITLDHYAQQVSILKNDIARCGSGGIQANGYGPGTLDVNHHLIIRRNHIRATGLDYMHSAAVTLFGSGYNDISLNWIADCPYAAVQICSANHVILNQPDAHDDPPTGGPAIDLQGDGTAQFQLRSHELPLPTGRRDPADYDGVKRFLHSGGNWVARNVVDEFMTTLGDSGALYCWGVDHSTVWIENLMKRVHHRSEIWLLYPDDWAGRQLFEGNLGWASAHGERGAYWDHSHTSLPAARPGPMHSLNNKPAVSFDQMTLVWWRENVNAFPVCPDGFSERFATIAADADYEGGWPESVTPELRRRLVEEEPSPTKAERGSPSGLMNGVGDTNSPARKTACTSGCQDASFKGKTARALKIKS